MQMQLPERAADFFDYARERHQIHLRRDNGDPKPWTDDPILQNNRFTCVFREDDKTTRWFRHHVRDPLRDKPEVLLATVVFRMFNRIEVGEAIFLQPDLGSNRTGFESFLDTADVRHLRRAIKNYKRRPPYTTGAYIISSPPGYSKLDGVLQIIKNFNQKKCETPLCGRADWSCVAKWLLEHPAQQNLKKTHEWLKSYDYLGKFHSYEIVTDLRHTSLLSGASDIDQWASVGPGARRGLNRIHGRQRTGRRSKRGSWGAAISEEQALFEMRHLLNLSREHWPKKWPAWEMREVEHTLCEFDKYERVRLGEGKPRGSFSGAAE